MIICPRCGKPNPDGTEFCLYCGNDLKGVATDPVSKLKLASDNDKNEPMIKNDNKRKKWSLIVIGVIVVSAIAILFLVL